MESFQEQQETNEEDDVRTVENFISLYQANKINKSNVWNCEIIDKLDTLVRQHNAYVRNFRNIGVSLDATMKVYEIRVDSVCNDVRRLGSGYASNGTSNTTMERSKRTSSQDACENVEVCVDTNANKRQRKRRFLPNIISNVQQLNAPVLLLPMLDCLVFRMNLISGDTGSSNRLFTTILPTKMSVLNLLPNENFIDNDLYDPVEFEDEYSFADQYFGISNELPAVGLPLRQGGSGLSGYHILDTPIDETDNEDDPMDVIPDQAEQDFDPEYQFDDNVESFWAAGQSESVLNNEREIFPDHMSHMSFQDMNNNDRPLVDDNENRAERISVESINKGEYSYQAFTQIKNYWAGPSYWKLPQNIRRSSRNNEENSQANPLRRTQRRIIEKPCFTESNRDSDSSDNEDFIKITAKGARKIRNINYRRWDAEKLRLPSHYDIPKDLFDSYAFRPTPLEAQLSEPPQDMMNVNDDAGDDFPYFDNMANSPRVANDDGDDDYNYEAAAPQNISEHFEDPPQMVEKIPISFDKRSKVINMGILNKLTINSIDTQLEKSAKNDIDCNITTTKELQPGRALFSDVFKDLLKKKSKFMNKGQELTTGLVLSSILNAVNKERLCLSKAPFDNNDFEIGQLT